MRRLFKITAATLIALILTFTVLALWTWRASQAVPLFYEQVRQPPPKELGDELERRALEVRNDLQRTGNWRLELTQEQINAWLALDLPQKFPHLLPEAVSEPRVAFEPRLVQVGCNSAAGVWTGILSFEVEPMLTAETNEVALCLRRARAGKVPIPLTRLLESVASTAYDGPWPGWKVRWKELDGAPVALLQAPQQMTDLGSHAWTITSLEVEKGKLVISGTNETTD